MNFIQLLVVGPLLPSLSLAFLNFSVMQVSPFHDVILLVSMFLLYQDI